MQSGKGCKEKLAKETHKATETEDARAPGLYIHYANDHYCFEFGSNP